MGFGDLTSAAGVKELNGFLADKSYIEGYTPSQADVTVFAALASAPGTEFAHALRWYNHIRSYSGDEQKSFACATGDYGVRGGAQAKKDDDDDDIDLFGSDDDDEEEEIEEEKRIREERLAKYAAKKANKKAVIAKSSLLIDVKPWDDETDMKALEEQITEDEDHVQSMDIAAFNKI